MKLWLVQYEDMEGPVTVEVFAEQPTEALLRERWYVVFGHPQAVLSYGTVDGSHLVRDVHHDRQLWCRPIQLSTPLLTSQDILTLRDRHYRDQAPAWAAALRSNKEDLTSPQPDASEQTALGLREAARYRWAQLVLDEWYSQHADEWEGPSPSPTMSITGLYVLTLYGAHWGQTADESRLAAAQAIWGRLTLAQQERIGTPT